MNRAELIEAITARLQTADEKLLCIIYRMLL